MIYRHIEKIIKNDKKYFSAILLTGARQVGKTTILDKICKKMDKVSLDQKVSLNEAKNDSLTFLNKHLPPVFIDEIQYAPDLFIDIKNKIDTKKEKGMYYLTGSQSFKLMKNVSDSLAGRIGIYELYGLSLREKLNIKYDDIFIPIDKYLNNRMKEKKFLNYNEIWDEIFRGSFPEIFANPDFPRDRFFDSYINTYIERDVREIINIGSEIKFYNFLVAVAARSGNILNISELARDTSISIPTCENWLSVLRASNIIYLLQPYSKNITKRIIKSPKMYFLDTGLLCYLTGWSNRKTIENSAVSGNVFETFVITEILKTYINNGKNTNKLYFYRDSNDNEIDLLIEKDNILYPVEIKKSSEPSMKFISQFKYLDKINGIERGNGALICTYDKIDKLSNKDFVIPVTYI